MPTLYQAQQEARRKQEENRKRNAFISMALSLPRDQRTESKLSDMARQMDVEDTASAIKDVLAVQEGFHKAESTPTLPVGTTPLDLPTLNLAAAAGVPELLQRPAPLLGRNPLMGGQPLTVPDLLAMLPPETQAGLPGPMAPPESFFTPEAGPPPLENLPLGTPVANPIISAITGRYGAETGPPKIPDYGTSRDAKAKELFGVTSYADLADPRQISAVQSAVRADEAYIAAQRGAATETGRFSAEQLQPLTPEERSNWLNPATLRPFPSGTTKAFATAAGAIQTSEKQRANLSSLTKLESTLDIMTGLTDELIKATTPIEQGEQKLRLEAAGLTGIGSPAAKAYKNQQKSFVGTLRDIFGQPGGVLTDQDIQIFTSSLPTFGDTQDLKDFKNATLKILLDAATTAQKQVMFGFEPDPELKKRIKDAISRLSRVAEKPKPASKRPEGLK